MNIRLAPIAALLAVVPSQALAQSEYLEGACKVAAAFFGIEHPGPLPPPPVCHLDQGCLQVDWNIAPAMDLTATLKHHRFDEKAPLRIYTFNVNLLRYKVQWTQVVERRVEGFERATTLLENVAPLLSAVGGGLGLLSNSSSDFLKSIDLANACLTETTGRLTDVVLDREGFANRQRLHEAQHVISRSLPILLVRRKTYLDTSPELKDFLAVAKLHEDFQKSAAEFLPLAKRSIEGETTVLKQEERNSVVVVTGQATTSAGEAVGQAVTGKYFVAWSRPVTYHVGYGYGRLKDFDFSQVRTLSGQDLFAATDAVDAAQAADTSNDLGQPEAVAFLTWELLRRGPNDRYGFGFTAGTGLQSPGESIYYGGTARIFSRLLVTIGGVSAQVTRGEGAVIDTTSTSGETRTLFSTLREFTGTRLFWSVSFKVY